MNNQSLYKTNNLIRRAQSYVLNRKLITFHSNDRDINKWPSANNFEIELPDTLTNIQSLRIVETSFPMQFYTFSNEYQNTKMSFRVLPTLRDTNIDVYNILKQFSKFIYTIDIQEGIYTPEQLSLEITNLMNNIVTVFLISKGISEIDAAYTYFKVTFDDVSQKFIFGNKFDNFVLEFDVKESYTLATECRQPDVWGQYTNWGLPYYIGYEKKTYIATIATMENNLYYRDDPKWLKPAVINSNTYVVKAVSKECLFGDSVMYMEIDKFNSMGEIVPFSYSTNSLYNNDYNGVMNAAFEKIPLNMGSCSNKIDTYQTFNSSNLNLQNISHYEPPIETIRKLKFKFRFHDGRLVDFQKCNFNFTIEFMCLQDEIHREYTLRVPTAYN